LRAGVRLSDGVGQSGSPTTPDTNLTANTSGGRRWARRCRSRDILPRTLIANRRWRSTPAIQAPIRQDWLDRQHEEIIEPELPIIDPHHHLWDRPGYRYLFQDLRADVDSGHKIVATPFAESGAMYRADGPPELKSLGETEFHIAPVARALGRDLGDRRSLWLR
jgi:hypothetical protein